MSHKDLLRKRIQQQTDEFLAHGGRISRVAPGVTGESENRPRTRPFARNEQSTTRTYVPEVVAAIESRRKQNNKPVKKRARKPVKTLVYDDFGEPLRWEWKND